MRLLLFAKHLRALTIPELARAATETGIDGYDWPVRDGYAVNPGNVTAALGEFVRAMRGEGLTVGMCTSELRLTDPADPSVDRIMGAMAENGIPFLKIGYFPFRGGRDYRSQFDEARRTLEQWQAPAARHGVTVCYHTHSGAYLGCNATALMQMIDGLDPRCVAAYLDAGHLAVAGEPFPMACSIAGDRLRLVGVKDMERRWVERDGKRVVRCVPTPIGGGTLETDLVFRHLTQMRFTGEIVLHVEFDCRPEALIPATRREAQACRGAMERAAAPATA